MCMVTKGNPASRKLTLCARVWIKRTSANTIPTKHPGYLQATHDTERPYQTRHHHLHHSASYRMTNFLPAFFPPLVFSSTDTSFAVLAGGLSRQVYTR